MWLWIGIHLQQRNSRIGAYLYRACCSSDHLTPVWGRWAHLKEGLLWGPSLKLFFDAERRKRPSCARHICFGLGYGLSLSNYFRNFINSFRRNTDLIYTIHCLWNCKLLKESGCSDPKQVCEFPHWKYYSICCLILIQKYNCFLPNYNNISLSLQLLNI